MLHQLTFTPIGLAQLATFENVASMTRILGTDKPQGFLIKDLPSLDRVLKLHGSNPHCKGMLTELAECFNRSKQS